MKYCDYNCEHAAFPDEALEGACRTVAAVWCKKLGRLVPKNSPCPVAEKTSSKKPQRRRSAK